MSPMHAMQPLWCSPQAGLGVTAQIVFKNFFLKKVNQNNLLYIYRMLYERKGTFNIYKARRTRVMCDFYVCVYETYITHFYKIISPPSSKYTHAYDSRAHMFYTPRHVCSVACT